MTIVSHTTSPSMPYMGATMHTYLQTVLPALSCGWVECPEQLAYILSFSPSFISLPFCPPPLPLSHSFPLPPRAVPTIAPSLPLFSPHSRSPASLTLPLSSASLTLVLPPFLPCLPHPLTRPYRLPQPPLPTDPLLAPTYLDILFLNP